MANPKTAQSALDMLILTILSRRGPAHGYGIANAIQEVPEEAEGRLEPVLAVDLIDEGSLALKQDATVSVEYELTVPRTAYLLGATRNFPRRNLTGLVLVCSFYGGLLLGAAFGAHYLGRAWRRLLKSRA
jgi:hypothetical protein